MLNCFLRAEVGLTKSAAPDHAQQGIRVNGMVQGAVRTAIITKNLDGEVENYNEERITAIYPMHLVADPSEITWLLSDEASFVTRYILSIDDGF